MAIKAIGEQLIAANPVGMKTLFSMYFPFVCYCKIQVLNYYFKFRVLEIE